MQRQNVTSKCNIKVQRQNVKLKSATSKCNVKMQRQIMQRQIMQCQNATSKVQRKNATSKYNKKKKMQRQKCNENAMAKMQEEKNATSKIQVTI